MSINVRLHIVALEQSLVLKNSLKVQEDGTIHQLDWIDCILPITQPLEGVKFHPGDVIVYSPVNVFTSAFAQA